MKITHENFIGIYEDAFDLHFCNALIKQFDFMEFSGYTNNRQSSEGTSKINKDDKSIIDETTGELNMHPASAEVKHFNSVFWSKCYSCYADTFAVLKESGPHGSYVFKMQKTEIGGGYHRWHYESDTKHACNTILVWTLYLNDVEEGGETEFLYLHKRVKPKAGTLVIWPAAFTHVHRGNPPISNSKYVATGWVTF